ncbi:MAG: hypothetical protein U0354_02945 [Candidatus Sericytochromatia bacterium]
MSKFFCKIINISIIISIILNFNLLSYSKPYYANNIYTIEYNNILISNNYNTNISINNQENILNLEQIFGSMFLSPLSFIVLFIFSYVLPVSIFYITFPDKYLINNFFDNNKDFITPTIALLYYSIINAFFVEFFSKNKNSNSFKMTFIGSLLGTFSVIILTNLAIFIEGSLNQELTRSKITPYQPIISLIFIPIFSSILAIVFNDLTQEKTKESDIKDLEKKVLKDYKEIVSKININNGKLSYSLVQF